MDLTVNDLISPIVQAYPTIFLYKDGEAIMYDGDNELEALKAFVEEHAGSGEK